ncbi:MAG: hypothetical protein NUV55_03905 [Sulfuricaulis sp.]|uniref:hypothetical protein n=1 Tax=Sulfuricaulis sp. TaxID=2003553 RepID=UPI0025D61E6D|nr:hypothetical protein [Sulfuricaulis sp.]MCR4346340.1 hypothetical protein [Sulfuricaulis sp.]
MTGNLPHDQGRAPPHSFLAGPTVASLFRAVRRAIPVLETPRPRFFAVPQSVNLPTDVKI